MTRESAQELSEVQGEWCSARSRRRSGGREPVTLGSFSESASILLRCCRSVPAGSSLELLSAASFLVHSRGEERGINLRIMRHIH